MYRTAPNCIWLVPRREANSRASPPPEKAAQNGAAGIDCESMQVVEPRRWARAWKLLVDTWRFRKAEAQYGNTLNLDAPWPCEPVIRGLRKCPRIPKQEPKHGPQPAQKFDPIARFRRKIWTPQKEQTPESVAWEDDQG